MPSASARRFLDVNALAYSIYRRVGVRVYFDQGECWHGTGQGLSLASRDSDRKAKLFSPGKYRH